MKIFLSWSGDQSRAVAKVLADWIPDVLLGVQPWMSDHDIQAGSRWAEDLGGHLMACQFAVICLTPENRKSPWILFEAGALSTAIGRPKIVPYLFNIKPANVEFPLAQFQSVDSGQDGTYKLVEAINRLRETPLDAIRLQRVFKRSYPELFEALSQISSAASLPTTVRSDRDLLEEIVSLLRVRAREAPVESHEEALSPPEPFDWEFENRILSVTAGDLAAMDDRELGHYRRQLYARFRRTDSREEEEALERQQRLADREYKTRQKRSPEKPQGGPSANPR
jgi:hypothetical protein